MDEKGRILVAEDDEPFRQATVAFLQRAGYRCDAAPDGQAAARMLQEGDYDLLVADIEMPGNAELELVDAASRSAKGMPVILVTAYPSLRSAIESVDSPVSAYLVKPLDLEELLTRVRAAVERHATYRAICQTHERLEARAAELDALSKSLASPAMETAAAADAFAQSTLCEAAGALSDLQELMDIQARYQQGDTARQLAGWPDSAMLLKGLLETIKVLQESKGSFRSKRLGDLRRKLEAMIEPLTAKTT